MLMTRYYTIDKYQTRNQGSKQVKCAWIDANGDQPCTGIQVYWPKFDNHQYPKKTDHPAQYCQDHTNLFFHKDKDPNYVIYKTGNKRAVAESTTRSMSASDAFEVDAMPNSRRRATTGSNLKFAHQLVKSHLPEQPASELCNYGGGGPSFASQDDRMFCYMPTKQLFPFCEDVKSGACWDGQLNVVVPKLVDVLVPAINFTEIVEWTQFRENQ